MYSCAGNIQPVKIEDDIATDPAITVEANITLSGKTKPRPKLQKNSTWLCVTPQGSALDRATPPRKINLPASVLGTLPCTTTYRRSQLKLLYKYYQQHLTCLCGIYLNRVVLYDAPRSAKRDHCSCRPTPLTRDIAQRNRVVVLTLKELQKTANFTSVHGTERERESLPPVNPIWLFFL